MKNHHSKGVGTMALPRRRQAHRLHRAA